MLARLALALACCAALNGLSPRGLPASSQETSIHLERESAVETASLFALGMRRLAGDLGLIRLIVYYGTPESGSGHEAEHQHHGGFETFDADHPERSYGGGNYPEMAYKAMRVLDADPSMQYAALYAAGALAFNLNRPDEALTVLDYALKRDPKNLQYKTYIGAVGFQRKGDALSVIRLLEPELESPDCPAMIKSMMAYLYLKKGYNAKAIRLYRDLYETSRDRSYRHIAEKQLRSLNAL